MPRTVVSQLILLPALDSIDSYPTDLVTQVPALNMDEYVKSVRKKPAAEI